MHHVKYFEDLFDTIPDFRKTVLLMFLNKNDIDMLKGCGFLKNDINRLKKSVKTPCLNKMKNT